MINYNKFSVNFDDCIKNLNDDGVAVLRNALNLEDINLINKKIQYILKNPSIAGSVGYSMKDPFKKTYDAFLIDKIVPSLVSNVIVLKLIKEYLKDDIIISEAFLKHDIGDNFEYFPYHRHTGQNNINKFFGCGIIIYLHDTDNGAFCYSIGSQKKNLDNEPEHIFKSKNKDDYIKNLRRINGKKGDIVIFDESGYHGPEQPTNSARTVIISGFRSKNIFQNKTKTEIPILNSSYNILNDNQKEALGMKSFSKIEYSDYHLRKVINKKIFSSTVNFHKFQFYILKFLIKLKRFFKH